MSGAPGSSGTIAPARPASMRIATTTPTIVMPAPAARAASLAPVLLGRLELEEERRPRHAAHAHLHERRPVQRERLADEVADLRRLLGTQAGHAVRVRELHEV